MQISGTLGVGLSLRRESASEVEQTWPEELALLSGIVSQRGSKRLGLFDNATKITACYCVICTYGGSRHKEACLTVLHLRYRILTSASCICQVWAKPLSLAGFEAVSRQMQMQMGRCAKTGRRDKVKLYF